MSIARMAARLASIAVAVSLACLFGTGTASADIYEWDSASPSGSSSGTCASTVGAHVCFVSYGDRLYVHDTASDGASAVLDWYINGLPLREGGCRNSMGNGSWGLCNN